MVPAGEAVTLCYGVEHAKTVALDPPVEAIDPSPNRCIQFTPKRTATYTLTATGDAGGPATASVTVRLGPRAAGSRPAASGGRSDPRLSPPISERVGPGQPATLCYSVNGAASVRIEPPVAGLGRGPARLHYRPSLSDHNL